MLKTKHELISLEGNRTFFLIIKNHSFNSCTTRLPSALAHGLHKEHNATDIFYPPLWLLKKILLPKFIHLKIQMNK